MLLKDRLNAGDQCSPYRTLGLFACQLLEACYEQLARTRGPGQHLPGHTLAKLNYASYGGFYYHLQAHAARPAAFEVVPDLLRLAIRQLTVC
jgi:hypothetical protein